MPEDEADATDKIGELLIADSECKFIRASDAENFDRLRFLFHTR